MTAIPSEPRPSAATIAVAKSDVPDAVSSVGSEIRPEDVDAFIRLQEGSERLEQLRTILAAWKQQQDQERSLRETYAKLLIRTLIGELGLIFIAFLLVASGVLAHAAPWMAEAFLVAGLAQSSALVLAVIKYLFPSKSSDVSQLLRVSLEGRAVREEMENS